MTSLIKFELGKILRNRTVFGGIVVGCLVLLGIFGPMSRFSTS